MEKKKSAPKDEEFSRSGLILLALYWLVGVSLMCWAGTQTDGYKLHVMHIPLPHPYPLTGVLSFVGIVTLEVGVLLIVMRPWSYHSEWTRLVLAMTLQGSLLFFFGVALIHAPPYMVWHWMWLLGGLVIQGVALAGTLIWIFYEMFFA
ncbi:MAG: hypothetical protein H6727_16990 [Myxococcales bacterium]|nr:hypothetical protein [Myxococcales bacterium]